MIAQDHTKTDITAIGLVTVASKKLKQQGNELARRDADLMLAHVLAIEPASIPLFSDSISRSQQSLFEQMIDRRLAGEPVAYITGEQGFWSLDFYVNQHTLIPRPDTELLVEVGLETVQTVTHPHIADLGTGSGCILLSLLSECPQMTGVGVDISTEALDVAKRNAVRHGLGVQAHFVQSNWFDSLAGEQFSLIVSNPPYIPAGDIGGLMSDVRDYEPVSALDGGQDGLDYYRCISEQATSYLAEEGCLAFEVGIGQFSQVSSIMEHNEYAEIQVFPDLAGVNRVVIGKKPKES